jgi:hypothetical protein
VLLVVLSAGAVSAAQRTFVSASGNDANPCSRALPCRSFGTAFGQTDAGGEVVVLESGGYGRVTINQSVAVIAPAGVHATITAHSEVAIHIATASTDVVILRGLYINGLGGTYGIYLTGGKTLHLENSVVSGFISVGVYGVAPEADVYVIDTLSFYTGNSTASAINVESLHGFLFVPFAPASTQFAPRRMRSTESLPATMR